MSDQNPEKKFGFDSFKAIRVKVPRNVPLPARIQTVFLLSWRSFRKPICFVCLFVCFFFLLSQLTCESPVTSHKNTILKYAASLYGEDLQWVKVTAFL